MIAQAAPQHPPDAREGESSRLPLLVLAAAIAVVFLLGVLILALNMRRGLNHDEHQFIAGGWLMAQGLRPYADFAWFHLPGQGWVNALLFQWFDHLLLTARLVSIVAATGTIALIMGVALRTLTVYTPWLRLLAATSVVLLLAAAQGYWFAAGRAWNHDLAILLALGAFCLLCAAMERTRRGRAGGFWLAGAAGILLGAATSVRLTIAPLALPFLLAPLCWGVRGRALWLSMLAVAVGVALGGFPIWTVFLSAPTGFLFGNFRYAALNTQWYAAQGADISLSEKVRAIALNLLAPGNRALLFMTAVALIRAHRAIRDGSAPEVRFWLLTLPFILIGAIAPTPMQTQYLFALFPFCALGIVLAMRHALPVRWFVSALGVAAVLTAVTAAPRYAEGVEVLPFPRTWYPVKIHDRGAFMAQMMEAQMLPREDDWAFTLSPILPLEGDVPIDTRTATGPFGWRIADLVAAEERLQFGLLGPSELEDALADSPPRALLTAMHSDDERDDDAAIEGWAKAHDYVAVPMPDEGTLWLSPLAQWGEIRLGAQTFPTLTVPGASLAGTLYLQSHAPTENNLNLLLRAVDVDGVELFRFDGWPYGSATSSWIPNELWQDGHSFQIPADTRAGNYRIEASFYDPETLETLADVATIGWIAVQEESVATNVLADLGAAVATQIRPEVVEAAPGEEANIEIIWEATAPLSTEYTRFAHLVDSSGTLVAQYDGPPASGFYPPSQWRAGVPVFDRLTMAIPADLPPGEYELQVGLYDAASGARLASSTGAEMFPVRVVITEVTQ